MCLKCNKHIYLSDYKEDRIVTIHNIQYPEDFYGSSGHNQNGELDEEIQSIVRKHLKELSEDGEEYGTLLYHTGTCFVITIKHEDEYVIFTANDYKECSIER